MDHLYYCRLTQRDAFQSVWESTGPSLNACQRFYQSWRVRKLTAVSQSQFQTLTQRRLKHPQGKFTECHDSLLSEWLILSCLLPACKSSSSVLLFSLSVLVSVLLNSNPLLSLVAVIVLQALIPFLLVNSWQHLPTEVMQSARGAHTSENPPKNLFMSKAFLARGLAITSRHLLSPKPHIYLHWCTRPPIETYQYTVC